MRVTMTDTQQSLLDSEYAEECPSCGAISAYAWDDVNYCPLADVDERLPKSERIYHIGSASGFEWECGERIRIDPVQCCVVRELHSTNVVTFHSNGRIVFDSGGWKTPTTKQRMCEFSPARVSQSRGAWNISIGGVSASFADGVTWDGSKWTGAEAELGLAS
jgi:hypothetical protein